MVGQLRTGQRVSISGSQAQADAESAGAKAKAAAGPQRVQVSGIRVLAEPAHPSSQVTVSQPAAGTRRLQQQRLPTAKLPVMTADVSTLVLPLSFEGCPSPLGGLYEAPWWTQQVGSAAAGRRVGVGRTAVAACGNSCGIGLRCCSWQEWVWPAPLCCL